MRRAIFALLIIFATATAQAQSPNDTVAQRVLNVGHALQQERVFLHFDNSAYYLGETMWFKAYVSYGTNDRTSTPSKVLYVELVAPEGYVVETKKYKLDESGCCNGEFELNPLLLSGYYEIRAYTRYMLNWGADAVFSRVFPIFDKVNGDNWDFKNMLDRKRGYTKNGEWVSSELPDAELDFYPEGGHLVVGLTSKVAYELRGLEGDFLKEEITIYANKQKLLTTTPAHLGKGLFEITPHAGIEYKAVVTAENKKGKREKFEFPLPEIKKAGVTIAAKEIADSISINIKSNVNDSIELAMCIMYRGAMGYYKKIAKGEKDTTFTIDKDKLPEGVNKATVFSGKAPLAERCFFVMHDSIQESDRSTIKLTVKGNDEAINELSLAPYEKITLNIAREDGKPIPTNANLSLSVSDAAGNVKTSWDYNMYTYLLLGSELKGYIPNAAQYFNKNNAKRKEQLDLLMLTNGWTAFNWAKLLEGTSRGMQPIEQGITIKGAFYRKNISSSFGSIGEMSLIPQKDNLTQLKISYDDKEISSYSFRTDSFGEFIVATNDFYGKRIVALEPHTSIRQNKNIKYSFALDRYFSPGFRKYDYWERNTGVPTDEEEGENEIVQLSPFEFMLSQVEVVSSAKKEMKSRPPHSEMRFSFLDEWEYAQDVSYLHNFYSHDDEVYDEMKRQLEIALVHYNDSSNSNLGLQEAMAQSGILNATAPNVPKGHTKYIGHARYTYNKDVSFRGNNFSSMEEYANSLTPAEIVTSAMKRHNYNWAYWVQFMVVKGRYNSDSVPVPDFDYPRGRADAEKMMNFKELVIRSDAKTRQQFENTYANWTRYSNVLDNKTPLQKFYLGFYSQHYVSTKEGIDGFPNPGAFISTLRTSDPKHPNYVACFIPYSEEEKKGKGIIPDLANTYGTTRYTSLQGYNESKQFYSPDYSGARPTEDKKEHRRTILWNPQLSAADDGSINVEFYNSYSCNTLVVDITGRDEQTYYSNDAVTTTRISTPTGEQPGNDNAEPYKESDADYFEKKMDPEVEAFCQKQHSIAIAYYNQKRYKPAISIWSELVKYNYIPSLVQVAYCYQTGNGLKKNDKQANKFFELAATQGSPTAQYELYIIYSKGIECERNEELAAKWLRRAFLQKEPRAMRAHAKILISEGKKAEAAAILAEARSSGNTGVLYEYGLLIIQEPAICEKTAEEGLGYIKTAADNGEIDAMFYMMEHEHKTQNYKEAYRYAKSISLAGRHEGTKRMADYYYKGEGVKRNKKLAKDLYRTAANAGNKEAADILKEL